MPKDTPLHKAANKGDTNSCMDIIEKGEVKVNEPGAANRTAFHRAVSLKGVESYVAVSGVFDCPLSMFVSLAAGLLPSCSFLPSLLAQRVLVALVELTVLRLAPSRRSLHACSSSLFMNMARVSGWRKSYGLREVFVVGRRRHNNSGQGRKKTDTLGVYWRAQGGAGVHFENPTRAGEVGRRDQCANKERYDSSARGRGGG